MVGKRLVNTGGAGGAAAFDPLQNFETVTYTGNGSTQKITGYIRKGAAFNGSSSHISTDFDTSGLNTISYSCWIYTSNTNQQRVISTTTDINGSPSLYTRFDGTRGIRYSSIAGGLWDTGNLNSLLNTWIHVAITDGGGDNVIVYVNGSSEGISKVVANGTYVRSTQIDIGRGKKGDGTIGDYFDGKLDQVRIFDKELSSSEVTTLYNETHSSTTKSTTDIFGDGSGVALYELDENANDTGGTYNGTATNVNYLGMALQPDLVWIKNRDVAREHILCDSVRGVNKELTANTTEAEESRGVNSFDSNGFTLDGLTPNYNGSGEDFVAWCWKAGGSVTPNNNTDGDITSTVSANQDAGFSIVSYTGNAGSTQTIGHGLSSAPEMIIVKNISDGAQLWSVYHSATGSGQVGHLNLTNSFSASGDWGSTTPTSTVFTIGSTDGRTNSSGGENHIAYCFHSVDGYQKVGSYTGGLAGSSNVIQTGFKPRFVLMKVTNTANEDWHIFDSIRGGGDTLAEDLNPNNSNAETNFASRTINFVDNGFYWSNSGDPAINASPYTYIYLAIA